MTVGAVRWDGAEDHPAVSERPDSQRWEAVPRKRAELRQELLKITACGGCGPVGLAW